RMIAESLTPKPGIREHRNPELENNIGTSETSRAKQTTLESKPEPVPGVRAARAECSAVRDSTLAACYRSLYAPRAGGAYDSHHRTAGVAGCPRRRGGGVAARGACRAARSGAAHWCTDGPRCKRS